MDDRVYKLLRAIALGLGLLWLGWAIYDHFATTVPGDSAYLAANRLFEDGAYERALAAYQDALAEAPDHVPALGGLANSLIQLGRYEEALAVLDHVIALDPDFAGHYANRGIAYDRLGRPAQAIADYREALRLDPDVAKGMHWLDRLLHNVQERPPTIADRLHYLDSQLTLPEDQRVLNIPELDRRQRPYEQ